MDIKKANSPSPTSAKPTTTPKPEQDQGAEAKAKTKTSGPVDRIERSQESTKSETDSDSDRVGRIAGGLADSLKDIDFGGDSKKTPPPERASEEEIREAIDQAGKNNDLDALNSVDYFRESLPPDQQKIYDERLQELREDDRIEFETDPRLDDEKYLAGLTPEQKEYAESLKDNPEAYQDLFLRGFLASSFGNPERLDEAIQRASESVGLESTEGAGDHEKVDGKFEVRLGVENLVFKGADGKDVEALAYANGGAISANVVETVRTLATPGDQGIPAHEFEHILNSGPRQGEAVGVPEDVSKTDAARLLELYKQANPGQEIDESHVYTDVLNDFLSNPHGFAEESPELYKLVADIQGYDPVAGTYPPPQAKKSGGIIEILKDLFGF